jgi:hypothetical protein
LLLFQISLLGPGNIDIAELLVRMQFAIYSSPSDFGMTPKSDNAKLNKASDDYVEDEEEREVIVENEILEVTSEEEEEAAAAADDDDDATVDGEKIVKTIESENLTIVVSEDPNDKDVENSERNVNDVSSQTHEHMKWTDLIDQEETKQKVIFYVLLTVHLGIILVNNQLDTHFFFVYVYFYSLHVSGNNVSFIRRINCINATSGICHCL